MQEREERELLLIAGGGGWDAGPAARAGSGSIGVAKAAQQRMED